jgi:hypothetical protein
MLLTAFFSFPFGRDQPTEIWALGKLQFWFKPRKRLWDQSGVKELVTITAPKKIERVYTDGLSQIEVQSRLKALANTIDSRGWAVKNVNITTYAPNPLTVASSDRLLRISPVPTTMSDDVTVQASDDILDERNNPIAHQFENLIEQSSQIRRQQLVDQMNATVAAAVPATNVPGSQSWFLPGNQNIATVQPLSPPTPTAVETPEEIALAARIHAESSSKRASYGNLRTLQPLSAIGQQPASTLAAASQQVVEPPITAVTAQPHPAILALANNNDLNVSTLAREANKAKGSKSRDGEVVISLH